MTGRSKFVSSLFKEINSLTDDIYENLMDNEDESAIEKINTLVELLNETKSTFKEHF